MQGATNSDHFGCLAMPDAIDAVLLDSIAHVIQMALTPVFLLAAL